MEYHKQEYPYSNGNPVSITTFFDADHVHDLENRRSITGVLFFPLKTIQ